MASGTRLRSQVCGTEVVVVRPGTEGTELTCGGHPLVEFGAAPAALEPAEGMAEGNQLGKRYTDESSGLELLVTKAGSGTLGVGTTPLTVKGAKPLPASD